MTENKQHVVRVVKPTADQMGHYDGRKWIGEFERGERIIMVDGVRWGRTRVTHHGMHGTAHLFVQDGGETLLEPLAPGSNSTRVREVEVRSMNKRRSGYSGSPEWRPTDELILEKSRELVAAGQLRDPKVVRAEQKTAAENYQKRRAQLAAEEEKRFRERACEAVGINQDDGSEIIDRVVAAMRWAQSQ